MAKKLIIIGIVLIALLGGAMGYIVYRADSLAKRYRPELERMASAAVGAPVQIGGITASIFPQTALALTAIRVGADADALQLDKAALTVSLSGLLGGALAISELRLDQPILTIVKDKSGVWLKGFPRSQTPTTSSAPAPSESTGQTAPPPPAESQGALTVNLEQFAIRNGQVRIDDQTAAKQYELSDLAVLTGVRLESEAIHLSNLAASASVAPRAEIGVKGEKITFAPRTQALEINGMSIDLLGNTLSIGGKLALGAHEGNLKVSAPGISIPSLMPLVQAFVSDVESFHPAGAVKLDMEATLEKPKGYHSTATVTLDDLAGTIGDLALSHGDGSLTITANTDTKNLSVDPFSLHVNGAPLTIRADIAATDSRVGAQGVEIKGFGGAASATLSYALQPKNFSVAARVDQMKLEEIVRSLKPKTPEMITGTLHGLTVDIKGSNSDDLLRSLHGSSSVEIRDGLLKGINLAADVLNAVKDIPSISGSLLAAVPPSARATLENRDTVIRSLTGTFGIRDGHLTTSDLVLESTLFSLEAQGDVAFKGAINLRSSIIFTPEFSAELAKSKKEIARLYDPQGRLVIPLTLQGTPPSISVLPDIEKLITLAGKNALKQEGSKLLERALGEKGKGLGGILGF